MRRTGQERWQMCLDTCDPARQIHSRANEPYSSVYGVFLDLSVSAYARMIVCSTALVE